MKEEGVVLKVIYELVKSDPSPVHLPVSPITISQLTGLSITKVQQCCKVLAAHGYLSNSASIHYYITKTGMVEAANPNRSMLFQPPVYSPRKFM